MNLAQNQTATLAPDTVIAKLAKFRFSYSATERRTRVGPVQDVKAVRAEVVLIQRALFKSTANDVFGGSKAFNVDDRVSTVLKDDLDPRLATG